MQRKAVQTTARELGIEAVWRPCTWNTINTMQDIVMAKRKKSKDLEATTLNYRRLRRTKGHNPRKRKQTEGCMLLAKLRRW